MMLFIGFSRLFVGGHYLTDVIAGYAVGVAWSGIVYMTIETYFVRRNTRKRMKRLEEQHDYRKKRSFNSSAQPGSEYSRSHR
jgi:hypothetical protein